jgi:CBS domain-containing protein
VSLAQRLGLCRTRAISTWAIPGGETTVAGANMSGVAVGVDRRSVLGSPLKSGLPCFFKPWSRRVRRIICDAEIVTGSGVLASHILKEKGCSVIAIPPEATLLEALLVLTPEGSLAGIMSARDIVRALAEDGARALTHMVAARMTTNVATCEENDTVAEIMQTMTSCRFGHMPVVEKGRVVGIVSTGDVVKTRIAETVREAQALKDYIATAEEMLPRNAH